jgi:hypothetical protein
MVRIEEEFIREYAQKNEVVWSVVSELIHTKLLTPFEMRNWLIRERYARTWQQKGVSQALSDLADDFGISEWQVRRVVSSR